MIRWIKDHIWLICFCLVLVVGFVVALVWKRKNESSMKLDDVVSTIKLEKKIIDEKATVAKQVAVAGHKEVAATIQRDHAAKIAEMDVEAKKKVEELAHDPEALVEHIMRATM